MPASNEQNLKKEVVEISRRSGAQGWCPGTLGNISFLNTEFSRIYIKRSGADLNKLELADILTLDLDGNLLSGEGIPSIETSFHVGLYKARKDAKSVFHVHPPYATAYAVAGKKIPMATEAAKIVLGDVPILTRAPAGSAKLATVVAEGFKNMNVKAALLRGHGLVTIGETLEKAYQTTALIEDTAKIAFLSSLIRR